MILKTRAVAAIATPKRHPKFFWMAKTSQLWSKSPWAGCHPWHLQTMIFRMYRWWVFFWWKWGISPWPLEKDDQPRESRDLGVPHFWIPDSCRKEQLRSRSFKPVFHRQMRYFIHLYPSLSIFIHLYPRPNHSPNIRCLGMKRIVVVTFSRKTTSTMENHHIFDR